MVGPQMDFSGNGPQRDDAELMVRLSHLQKSYVTNSHNDENDVVHGLVLQRHGFVFAFHVIGMMLVLGKNLRRLPKVVVRASMMVE